MPAESIDAQLIDLVQVAAPMLAHIPDARLLALGSREQVAKVMGGPIVGVDLSNERVAYLLASIGALAIMKIREEQRRAGGGRC